MNACGQLMMTASFASVCAFMFIRPCMHMYNTHSYQCVCLTWFLKESFLTGSSAAKLMLLSRMKKRMRLVKMLWFTILWHRTLNLKERGRIINWVSCCKHLREFHMMTIWGDEGRVLTCWCGWRWRKRGPLAWERPSPSAECQRAAAASGPLASQAHRPHRLLKRRRKDYWVSEKIWG